MEQVFGPGIRLDNERKPALRSALRILPTPEELILPICPWTERNEWQTARIGEQLQPERAAALCGARGRAVCPPVAGRVTALEERSMPGGESWLCMILAVTGEAADKYSPLRRQSGSIGREEILQAAAVTSLTDELDGADLSDKLRKLAQERVEILVCDAVCDDPYNTDALRALLEHTEEVLMGLELAASACGGCRMMVVTSRAAEATARAATNLRKQMNVPYLDVTGRYPIWVNLQQKSPFAGHRIGRIGPQACLRLLRAARLHRAPDRCIITVGGSAMYETVHYSVTVGTPISKVLERCEMVPEGSRMVAVYAALRGESVWNTEETPVTQNTRCILAFTALPPVPRACIGCGRCVASCPAGVFPLYALRAMERGDKAQAEQFGLRNCIDCRACEAACPANIPVAARLLRAADKEPKPLELWRNRREVRTDALHR
jgi:electron transport complex protein RnfC